MSDDIPLKMLRWLLYVKQKKEQDPIWNIVIPMQEKLRVDSGWNNRRRIVES